MKQPLAKDGAWYRPCHKEGRSLALGLPNGNVLQVWDTYGNPQEWELSFCDYGSKIPNWVEIDHKGDVMEMKFRMTVKNGLRTVASIEGIKDISKSPRSVDEVHKDVIEIEQAVERLTGLRVHLDVIRGD